MGRGCHVHRDAAGVVVFSDITGSVFTQGGGVVDVGSQRPGPGIECLTHGAGTTSARGGGGSPYGPWSVICRQTVPARVGPASDGAQYEPTGRLL